MNGRKNKPQEPHRFPKSAYTFSLFGFKDNGEEGNSSMQEWSVFANRTIQERVQYIKYLEETAADALVELETRFTRKL